MVVFRGREYAGKVEDALKRKVEGLRKKPRLAIVFSGDDEGSKKYVEMKSGTAKRVGMEVVIFEKLARVDQAKFEGVMVQLPSKEDLSLIWPQKDVDGLNPQKSDFVPAVVRAVGKILRVAEKEKCLVETASKSKVAVVGAKGSVGRGMVKYLRFLGSEVGEFDAGDDLKQLVDFEVVISAVGKPGLIKPEMVREGVVAIDVGYPKGDFDEGVKEKAAFWTPVPGGVGPVTVVSLLENIVKPYEKR